MTASLASPSTTSKSEPSSRSSTNLWLAANVIAASGTYLWGDDGNDYLDRGGRWISGDRVVDGRARSKVAPYGRRGPVTR